jgi:hypothetical protein
MKKIIIVILLFSSVAVAVTTITYNIPDNYGVKLLDAYIAQSDARVRIEIRGNKGTGSEGTEYYHAILDFRTPVYDPNVPHAAFVKRRTALFVDALRVAHERKLKVDSYEEYIAGAPSVDVNEPDPNEMN